MITLKPSSSRGTTDIDWLKSWHSFSFGEYYDPSNIRFGPLRVINEDIVAPGGGFPFHPHNNMEIITLILSGELEHKDTMGNHEVIRPGEFQKMSAGSGIRHSEFNPSNENPVHLMQIWIVPDKANIQPYYEQTAPDPELMKNRWFTAADSITRPQDGVITMHQDAALLTTHLDAGKSLPIVNIQGRGKYLHVVSGSINLNGVLAKSGDACLIEGNEDTTVTAEQDAVLLLFDVSL